METIKPLPESVQSIVRSGFIISCFSTVVEELIYNSLDAGATKVSVSVAVNNGYVKVEDDGSGISRDGLVLLGERYVTSKLRHIHEKDNLEESFGFRGEVLCSIADISLVEVVTRVQGRPNGYRKVMKGRKCLCLSIDNDRQDAGTTVIVRDLFYNQPVRRRQMQCSVKKVLHSVKKCAVQIALVQPNISFKVIDMESEDELLRTRSCPSPLTLLCSNFGIESSSLHELSFSEGPLKITGYVSSLSSSFLSKDVQYIYVNSRFVDKGPMHKLLNHLAFMCHDQLGSDSCGKRSQPQGPAYCLNLSCPRYSYDLNLEFSRASVEFKDWAPVLAFIEKSVMSTWSEEIKRGISHKHEADLIRKDDRKKVVETISSEEKDWWLKTCEMSTKRRRIQNSENQLACPEDSLGMQIEDCDNSSVWKNSCRQHLNPEKINVKFRESDRKRESPRQMNFTGVSEFAHSDHICDVTDSIGSDLLGPDKELVDRDFLRNDVTSMEKEASYANINLFNSRWKDEVSVDSSVAWNLEKGSAWSFEFMPEHDENRANDDQRELLLQSYPWENPTQAPLNCDKESQFQTDNFKASRSCNNSHGNEDADSLSHNFDIHQRAQCHIGVANTRPLPKSDIGSLTRKDLDLDHMEYDNLLSSCGGSFIREYPLESPSKPGAVLFPCSSKNLGLQSASTHPFIKVKDWDFDNITQYEDFERKPGVTKSVDFEQSNYEKEEFCESGLGDRFCNTNFTSMHHLTSTSLFTNEYAGVENGMCEYFSLGHSVDDSLFKYMYSPSPDRKYRDSSICWSPFISSIKGNQMDLQKCQEFGQDYPRERSGRGYDSSDGLKCNSMVTDETFSPCLDFQNKLSSYKPSVCFSSLSDGKGHKSYHPRRENLEQNHSSLASGSSVRFRRSRFRRSHSAPPFFRGKKRFLSVKNSMISTTKNSGSQRAPEVCTVPEKAKLKHPLLPAPSSRLNFQYDGMKFREDSQSFVEYVQEVKETSNITQASAWSLDGNTEDACFSSGCFKDFRDSETSNFKWREGCPDPRLKEVANNLRAGNRLIDLKAESDILDVQSCMLDLAGDLLVPKSINRIGLQNAKVLVQIDSKFIPVVANGTLAVIDQHAADERIRLEEMRRKVLSGELKSINYLEKEKDLVLPEMAYQLLCNYAEHIKHWGWICNIFSQDSGSFTKNLSLLNERASNLTLIAVPCILGVNLSDKDLVEFLEQLADTDGSSIIPPSVVRILNYKACRGAIMFGDKLMPSECSLIVEELKQKSLCFQFYFVVCSWKANNSASGESEGITQGDSTAWILA
ncbi:DNA mismatch repair protein MLH3-like isoform X2 [Chenopodium quinoa]|uniref:DNA mismatch repair protein MLH3-like isoform X2 n=1 Tax=Chenopodium quinoa TaxID=63459 RepID=UPI000B7995FB|nr:DNA mismatch repair protein MLH3-like isoform X2 [Chenopodium quinoa]